ncbi:hypothetical protein [Acidithiobacillus ferrooxidans]|uniref:hypothetical protein n=1 Tax=Acidithiobacillus ferrooxidans TaxID=920 RepID=UPI001C06F305|nr:hypothetical protein [Acidithiobacillus ferrooxidans]
MSFFDKETLRKAGKVFCGECQHFEPGITAKGVGFCALTKNRTVLVKETNRNVPDRQGLPPDPNPDIGYPACFPMAPRACAKFQPAKHEA